ncbi:TatD family hydrolase [Chitinivibrio alkaliphilus]|uniref:TatD family hydrolase n=1 Tax=Chitinivibrio alkaliphilus ACht1 TaxID=1313304 RepID=U7D7L6_9BACT|nr:TatD family hydrolase [Chitinivibrio alkaliphilus]ERP38945.1 TatD family hydrolase [Chitinivibrio alkaliphilus ACht1]
MWIDSHCHLYNCSSTELASLYEQAARHRVTTLVTTATDVPTSMEVQKQVLQGSTTLSLYGACGISPESALREAHAADIETLSSLVDTPGIIAIGEIGMDGIQNAYPPMAQQEKLFRRQLRLAKTKDLPVILHSRGVERHVLNILQEEEIHRALFHCYTGDAETARSICNSGYHISFSGIITFKNAHFDTVIRACDPAKILIETDSPYLSPEPYRGKANTPQNAYLIGKYIATVLGISEKTAAEIFQKTFSSLFGTPAPNFS